MNLALSVQHRVPAVGLEVRGERRGCGRKQGCGGASAAPAGRAVGQDTLYCSFPAKGGAGNAVMWSGTSLRPSLGVCGVSQAVTVAVMSSGLPCGERLEGNIAAVSSSSLREQPGPARGLAAVA